MLRCLLGISKVKTGKIRINGYDISTISPKELAKNMAYVPQATTTIFPHRVLDMVVMGRTPPYKFYGYSSRGRFADCRRGINQTGYSTPGK